MKSTFLKLNKEITIFTVLSITVFLVAGCASANHPPSITSLKAGHNIVTPSGSCQVECIASDPDGDELSYEWSAGDGNIGGTGPTVTWSAPNSEGTYTLRVKITDGNGGKTTDSTTITVSANHPPSITSLTASKERVAHSGSCQVECIASDPDGDGLTYAWSASGGNISGTGPTITWTAPETVDTYTITVKVIDEMGNESTSSLSIDIAPNKPPNEPPIIKDLIVTAEHRYLKRIPEGYKILKGKSCHIKCVASDPDKDKLLYEWSTDGGNISRRGSAVTWTAPLRGGEVTITVTVSDSNGGVATKSVVFKVKTCTCSF